MSLKTVLLSALAVLTLSLAGPAANAATERLPAAEVGEDGLHVQPWFHDSFLDLNEDLAEAHASGKRLVVFWEQRGCPYCKRLQIGRAHV